MASFIDNVKELQRKVGRLYIYGAGLYGQNIYKILEENHIEIYGFIVTKKGEKNLLHHKPIFQIDEIERDNIGIIVGANRNNEKEIINTLSHFKIENDKILRGSTFIDNNAVRGGYDQIPTLEITTRIGCRVNCKYCPQNTLMGEYFKSNKDRKNLLDLETFRVYLDKIPKECTILFSGMAEPFLNKDCTEMIRLACAKGHKVDLYTTLEGVSLEELDEIVNLPIDFVGLHVADKHNFAKIEVNEDYYKKIEKIINTTKEDGSSFVKVCNAQTEPVERIKEICEGKYPILTTMLDRAGNLQDDGLYRKNELKGKLSCSLCGKKLNHNILLPDGTVLLCCMDYGMKHVIGNLNEESYKEILNGDKLKEVKEGLDGNESIEILCRNCSCANEV